MPHSLSLRVYYEDTDLAGVVYYANYLKFIERGRSEWVRSLGIDQGALRRDTGIVFAVRHLEADYLRPAVFDDWLTVTTAVQPVTGARPGCLRSCGSACQRGDPPTVTQMCWHSRWFPGRITV